MDYTTKITPTAAFTEMADFVAIRSTDFGPPPSFTVLIGKFKPGSPAIPEHGIRGHSPDYKPAVPAVPDALDVQKTVTVAISQEEWDAWPPGGDDAAYIKKCIFAKLGLTEVAEAPAQ